jgi:hypothetical protein
MYSEMYSAQFARNGWDRSLDPLPWPQNDLRSLSSQLPAGCDPMTANNSSYASSKLPNSSDRSEISDETESLSYMWSSSDSESLSAYIIEVMERPTPLYSPDVEF